MSAPKTPLTEDPDGMSYDEEAPEEEEPSYDPMMDTSPYPEEQPNDSPLGLAAIHRAAMECPNPLDGFQEVEFPNPQSDPYESQPTVSEAAPEDTQDFWSSFETSPLARDEVIKKLQERASQKALASEKFQSFNKNRK